MYPVPHYPPLPEPTLVPPAAVQAVLDDLVAEVAATIGKTGALTTTVDTAIREAVEASAVLIDNHLGAGSIDALAGQAGVLPAPIRRSLVIVAGESYRRKDAAFGVLAQGGAGEPTTVRIGADWLRPVESMLAPLRTDNLGVW